MPKKLMNCIKKVMKSGKSESEAWKICISSTGLKPHKGSQLNRLVTLANTLDEAGFKEEATALDDTLVKEAQSQWFKEKGQQLKDWFSTEKQLDPEMRKQLTTLRQNHWNLIKQINSARTMLNTVWHNMGKPEYVRDLKNVIQYLKRDLTQAAAAAKQAGSAAQALQTQKVQTITKEPFDPEKTQIIDTTKLSSVENLLKIADTLEWFNRAQDWAAGKMLPEIKKLSTLHWNLMDKLNSAYGKLQAARQNITNVSSYVDTFLTEISAFEQDLGSVLQSIAELEQVITQVPENKQTGQGV